MHIYFERIHSEAKVPEQATEGAACADMHAVFHGEYDYTYIPPRGTVIIKTGLKVEVPEGYELQIRARSGLAARGIMLANGVGTVDSDYRGEVGVVLYNSNDFTFPVYEGDRIAQCCIQKVLPMEFTEAGKLSSTARGEGGYGSTGVNT